MKYDIVIVGGGTAGWLSAAFLKYHNKDKTICLVEDPNIPPIGVGEGTFPTTMYLLQSIGIPARDAIVKANAGIKVGIQYRDFADDAFWLSVETPRDWENYGSELIKSVGLSNKCPIISDDVFFAMHFVASDLAALLRDHACGLGVDHISSMVVGVELQNNTSKHIKLSDERTIAGDWFVDCSGFAKLLIGKTDTHFTSYNKELLVDSAVVGPTQYKNKEREFNPFTQLTAQEAGWIFRIPTYTRIGNGYVYSSKFTDKQTAEDRLRQHSGVEDFKHLSMTLGYYDDLIVNNIVAVGLSGGFIEPMEATAIHIAERTLIVFNEMLQGRRDALSANQFMRDKIRYIKTMILGHYAFSKRQDPFWQAAQKAAFQSNEIQSFLAGLNNKQFPTAEDELDQAYPYCQWNDLLRGFGEPHHYPTINNTSKQQIYMASYYLPNHYSYITSLRNDK